MKNIFVIALFSCLLAIEGQAQETKDTTNDTWFVWIDATAQSDGQTSRIVSNEPFKITCCVKSPKYRKLLKRAEKWIQKNVDENYRGESPLGKIQDADLALTMIKEATEQNTPGTKLIRVDYKEKCN
ncbi:hypothetical protein QQ020_03880 [Fulvivirgaceae bacterium BMA12]|uniref:Uncharacterized protein n=1 Tax=Agaribacillus aureus TaxID=3051825 RepID=A0ABT8L0E0_9BACT|nr:hypothetical protein [Fulvivirgaceae bacterium BMA12]